MYSRTKDKVIVVMAETEKKTITLKKEVIKKVEELAKKENRNFSNMVETLILKNLE